MVPDIETTGETDAETADPEAEKRLAVEAGRQRGSLVDSIVFVRESEYGRAISRLKAGTMHIMGDGRSDPEMYRRIQNSPKLGSEISYGSYGALSFNPVGPTFPTTGKLNPFSVPKIREAMNRLIDREHIAQEIFGGLAVPRYFPISSVFPDYARLADVARTLELRYEHDPAAAEATIAREMEKLGAQRIEGHWMYEGEQVEVILLIRVEDARREVGDYVANLLEGIGFQVTRLYRTAQEATRIWMSSHPREGRWHAYTASWISVIISRDQASNFGVFYTPRGRAAPLWQAYEPSPEFDELADRLQRRDFTSWEERQEMMARALELSMKESYHVWLTDQINVWPKAHNVQVAADLAGGMTGSILLPYTVRIGEELGGRLVFGATNVLAEPWNPVDGSNWIFDTMIMRATSDRSALGDPHTGLYHPQRIESAEVTVAEGTPVIQTLDWVTLDSQPEIEVPLDTWIDWDPEERRFITVAEKHPEGLTARTRTRIHFTDDYLETLWHDGSRVSLADMVLSQILTFDRAKPESPLYDEGFVPMFRTFQTYYRGFRIVSRDPVVVESYSDRFFPDAEWIAAIAAPWPGVSDGSGIMGWHSTSLGIRAEEQRLLAFSSNKADQLRTEWMSYVTGPSLEVLAKMLEEAREESYLPFEETLREFVSEEEIEERYSNLADWYEARGHFWVCNGPFYLHALHPIEGHVEIRRFERFADPADKWLGFTRPRIPEVVTDGPGIVHAGEEASFEISITFEGAPYPEEELEMVRYMLFDGRRELIKQGDAVPGDDGRWRVELSSEETEKLRPGSNLLEIAATSTSVALPAFDRISFATIPEVDR